MSKGEYIQLKFDELNEKGLTSLTKAMAKAGYEVAKVVPAGKSRKKDGIATRTFTLIGLDEQVMEVQVNDTGDISGIKVNGKTSPYQPVKTLSALAQSLSALFKRGATAFQKALARKMARAAKKNLDGNEKKPTGVKSNAQQLADAKALRDTVSEDIQQVKNRLGVVQTNSDNAMTEAEKVKAALSQETARTRQLKEEIAQLEEAA
ncbi:hypothetical protein ACX5DY_005064 [Enterobacter hormaechei]